MIQTYSLPPERTAKPFIHALLVPFPVVCFFGTLATDLAYWASDSIIWETFSVWLLTVGLVMAAFAVLAGLVDLGRGMRLRGSRLTPLRLLGAAVVIALSLINVFVHSRDGYTAVVPTGLGLSALVAILMIVIGWSGWSLVPRGRLETVR